MHFRGLERDQLAHLAAAVELDQGVEVAVRAEGLLRHLPKLKRAHGVIGRIVEEIVQFVIPREFAAVAGAPENLAGQRTDGFRAQAHAGVQRIDAKGALSAIELTEK